MIKSKVLNAIVESRGKSMMTLQEVATYLRCSYKSVWRAVTSGKLRSFKPAGKHLIMPSSLAAYIVRKGRKRWAGETT